LDEAERESRSRWLNDYFEIDWQAIKENEGSGHTPCYITHDVQRQSKENGDPYPNGLVRIIAMTRTEGVHIYKLEDPSLGNGQLFFTAEEVEVFWQQIVHIDEYDAYFLLLSTTLSYTDRL